MKIVFILPLFFCSVLFAADVDPAVQYREAKFSIIKRTMEFLSTDPMFHDVKKHQCEPCTDYPQLKKFAEPITGGVGLISEWFGVPVTNKEQLEAFRRSVIDRITGNGKNPHKAKRKEFPDYNQYLADISKIVDAVPANTPPAEDEEQDTSSGTNTSAPKPTKEGSLEAQNVMLHDSIKKLNAELQDALAHTARGKDYTLYYIGGLVALTLISIYLFSTARTQRRKKEELKKNVERLRVRKTTIEEELASVRNASHSLKERTEAAEGRSKELEEKLANERKRNQQKGRDINETRYESTHQTGQVHLSKEFRPVTKYARYADKGDGFSSGDLLDACDSETIFEITITSPGAGAFSISSNRQAQKYALSNASYFFNNTCQYDTLPSPDSVISTTTPGELVLNGDKWTIQNPAKIRFN